MNPTATLLMVVPVPLVQPRGWCEAFPTIIEFPGMVELWERFWSEVPKSEFNGT
jgi:hypothetical protein